MFGALLAADGTSREAIEAVAREFSPRIEVYAACASTAGRGGQRPVGRLEVALDLNGVSRLFGDARTVAQELRRTAADRGLRVRVAIASTRTAARLLVHCRAGITVVEPGQESAVLAPLPIGLLAVLRDDARARNDPNAPNVPNGPNDLLTTLRHWGVRTLGEFVALVPEDVAARLGQHGVEWQRRARGEDPRPLVPAVPDERFEQALDLEWPIEGLEPLSFVLGRLMEPLEAHLARRDRGAAVLHVRLHLVKAAAAAERRIHERSLQLPVPMRDARALRTLALLDLESHPPGAAIDRVVVAVDPTPGRVVQFSLLTRALPSPERLSTLMARLSALMGEDRCGSPVPVDTWQPGAFAMKPFAPGDADVVQTKYDTPRHRGTEDDCWSVFDPFAVGGRQRHGSTDTVTSDLGASVPRCVVDANPPANCPALAIRRFRIPLAARVRVEDGVPVRVAIERRGFSGGRVEQLAGPWRTSGAWWRDDVWDRDEWDVTLSDGATYRVFHERAVDRWFVDGVVD